jgi:hypothetical protein
MNEKKFDISLVSLEDITVKNASLENKSEQALVDLTGLETSFQYELHTAISLSSKKVRITANYDIRAGKSNSNKLEISSSYSIVFIYAVQNLLDLVVSDEQQGVSVDDEMLSNLFNISYSTSRGILYTRYLGSFLHGFILPIISTAELFESPSAIKSIPTKS